MAAGSVQAEAIARILERREDSETRYVDMELGVRASDGSWLGYGGRWDRVDRRYVGAAEHGRIETLIPSQDEIWTEYAEWLRRRVTGDWASYERPYTLMWRGGRRAGKSRAGLDALLAFAVAVPGSIVWAVAAKDKELDELRDVLRAHVPAEWARFHRASDELRFANGTVIRLLSGYKADNLKQGRCDLCLVNEAQKVDRKVWVQARGAVADTGGLVILACNPPDNPRGIWVQRLEERVEAGGAPTVRARFVDNQRNTAIDGGALEALRAELGETDHKTYRREVLGEYVPLDDTVISSFSCESNVREVPDDWTDVTREWCRIWANRSADTLVGCDFDLSPGCQGAVIRLYLDPGENLVRAVQVDEVENADGEGGLAESLIGLPYLELPGAPDRETLLDPDQTLLVADATGRTQEAGRHEKGASSWGFLRAAGFRPVGPQHPKGKGNPGTADRYSLHNLLCHSTAGARRFLVRPSCTWAIESLREYPMRNGRPARHDDHAHHVDAQGYALWYVFGRDLRCLYWVPGVAPSSMGSGGAYTTDPKRRARARDRSRASTTWGGGRGKAISTAKKWRPKRW